MIAVLFKYSLPPPQEADMLSHLPKFEKAMMRFIEKICILDILSDRVLIVVC